MGPSEKHRMDAGAIFGRARRVSGGAVAEFVSNFRGCEAKKPVLSAMAS